MVLTEQQKLDFIRDGYLILRNVIPEEKIKIARQHVNRAYNQKKYTLKDDQNTAPNFLEEVQKRPELSELPNDTPVVEAIADLLGPGNGRWGKGAQIAFRLHDAKLFEKGFTLNQTMNKRRYHVDGGSDKYRYNGTAFSILLGIPLSWGQMKDENRGQLNVWPGSHVTLHELIKERVTAGVVDGHNTLYGDEGAKADIGEPIRVRMKPGDAVLAHQRLGHSGGWNMSDVVRKNLYMRVKHRRHDELLEEQWSGSLWTMFEGLHDMVGYKPAQ